MAALVAMASGLAISWGLRPANRSQTVAGTSSAYVSLASIEAQVDPVIVDVVSVLDYGSGEAAGTGIVLTSSGEILTNNHVIDGATSIRVTDVGNGRTYTATVIGYDESADVAVLQLQGASGLKTASIGDSSKVTVGESVTALGNAGGVGGTPSATTGTVTGLNQSITASDEYTSSAEQLSGLVESNANVHSGDSGGPLVDTRGQVIAMDTAASTGFQFQPGTTGTTDTTTHSYSIPINQAIHIADEIEAGQAFSTIHTGTTAFLGVEIGTTDSSPGSQAAGVEISGVVSGSPAAAAGLSAGDEVISVGGTSVGSASALSTALISYHPGDKVTVTWSDLAGQTHTATLALGTGPAA